MYNKSEGVNMSYNNDAQTASDMLSPNQNKKRDKTTSKASNVKKHSVNVALKGNKSISAIE